MITRFGYVGYARVRSSTQLEAGMREVARREGVDVSRLYTSPSFSRSAQSWGRFQSNLTAWVAQLRPPVGVLGINDKPARYVLNAAWQMGLRVPADVAAVGVENETVVTSDSQGEKLTKRRPVGEHDNVPIKYNFKRCQFTTRQYK